MSMWRGLLSTSLWSAFCPLVGASMGVHSSVWLHVQEYPDGKLGCTSWRQVLQVKDQHTCQCYYHAWIKCSSSHVDVDVNRVWIMNRMHTYMKPYMSVCKDTAYIAPFLSKKRCTASEVGMRHMRQLFGEGGGGER